MKETDLAYAAGLIDGEGCIRIKKCKPYGCQGRTTPGYHACLIIRMVDREAIAFIANLFGGNVLRQKPSANNGKPLYCCQISDQKAEDCLRLLMPYLKVKRPVARTVLTLRRLQRRGRAHRTKINGWRNFPNSHGTPRQVPNLSFSDEYVGWCETLYLRVKAMNRPGIPIAEAA